MGCADSQVEPIPQLTDLTQFNNTQNLQKMKEEFSNRSKKQIISYSDYEAFMLKSQQQGTIDYPSTFKFIKIQPITDELLNKIKLQEADPLSCTRKQLIDVTTSIISQNSFAKSKLNPQNLKLLITEIAHNYNSVSYHNFSHGFSLMQMLYKCFKMDDFLRKTYSDEDLTYYLIAGITHDVNHPGTNNIYEVKMKSELAKVAENDAVLEKMHLQTFLNICKSNPEFDIISKSSNPQKTKEKITRAILATDMAKHFKNLERIQKHREQKTLNFGEEEIKLQMMENLIHACDIGNSLLPFDQYIRWGALLTFQFNEQTKLEANNKLEVTQFLRFKGLTAFYDDQIGFLSKFVIPLWTQINVNFPSIKKMVDQGTKNLQKIKELKEQKEKEQK